jgi:hypothetical protein
MSQGQCQWRTIIRGQGSLRSIAPIYDVDDPLRVLTSRVDYLRLGRHYLVGSNKELGLLLES